MLTNPAAQTREESRERSAAGTVGWLGREESCGRAAAGNPAAVSRRRHSGRMATALDDLEPEAQYRGLGGHAARWAPYMPPLEAYTSSRQPNLWFYIFYLRAACRCLLERELFLSALD